MLQTKQNSDNCIKSPSNINIDDAIVFGQFYNLLHPAVSSFLTKCNASLDFHEREDIVQETFLRTWKLRAHFRNGISKAILFGVARNVLREKQRSRVKLPIILVGNPEHLPHSVRVHDLQKTKRPKQHEFSKKIAKAAEKLTPSQKKAYILVHVRKLPISEAAKHANCPPHIFWVRLHSARKRLRVLVKKTT